MKSAAEELKKIEAFVESLKLSSPGLAASSELLNRVYRRFHGLLVFDLVIENSTAATALKEFSREGLADASATFFLTAIGVYKPGRMSLRSSIENYLRFFVGMRGVSVSTIATVYELFAKAREQAPLGSAHRPMIDRLHTRYAELCKTSHTTKLDYMSLEVPFERLVRYNGTTFTKNLKDMDVVYTQALQLLYAELHPLLGYLDTENADYLRDSVPRSLKRALSS